MPDDGWFFVEELSITLFSRQRGHGVDSSFVFFEVFLQNLNGVIFLGSTPSGPYFYVIPADSEEFAIRNAVQVFVGYRAVHKMEIRRKKPGAVVEVGRDFVIIFIQMEVPHIPRNDKIVILRHSSG